MSEEVAFLHMDATLADEIIHVTGRKGATVMTTEIYERLFLTKVVVNAKTPKHICNIKRYRTFVGNLCVRPDVMQNRGYSPLGNWKKILRGESGKSHGSNGRCWPTTGLFAIDMALVETRPENIYLYGFDCYRENYLVKRNRPYQTQKDAKVKMMYVHLKKLVEEFPDTQFHCASRLEIEAPNWKEI